MLLLADSGLFGYMVLVLARRAVNMIVPILDHVQK
jgi:hypothetical protein